MSMLETLKTLTDVITNNPQQSQFKFDPAELYKIAADYDSALAKIKTDVNLSAAGKQSAKIEAVQSAFAEATQWKSERVDGLSRRIEIETAALTGTKAETTDQNERLIRELRHQEIRRNFESLDPLQVEITYIAADPEVRDALASAPERIIQTDAGPRLLPLVPKEVVERTALAEAKNANPVATGQIHELAKLRDAYQSAVAMLTENLKKEIQNTNVVLGSDPIAKTAKRKRKAS